MDRVASANWEELKDYEKADKREIQKLLSCDLRIHHTAGMNDHVFPCFFHHQVFLFLLFLLAFCLYPPPLILPDMCLFLCGFCPLKSAEREWPWSLFYLRSPSCVLFSLCYYYGVRKGRSFAPIYNSGVSSIFAALRVLLCLGRLLEGVILSVADIDRSDI